MAIVSILRPIKYNPDTGKYEQNIKVVNSGGQIVNDIQIIETEQVPSISEGITGGSGSLTLITEDLTNSMEDGKLTYTLSNTYNANSLNVYYCGLNITKDLASKSSNGFTLISDYSSIIKAPSGDSSLFVVYTIGSSSGSVDYIATVDINTGTTGSVDLSTQVTGSLDSYYLTGNYIQNLSEDTSPQLGGNLDVNGFEINGIIKINDAIHETFSTVNAATGTVTHNCSNGHVFYHTNPSADWTSNFINLDLSTNYTTNISLVVSQGATPRIPSGVQISGSSQTIYWKGGTPPTGTASGKDVISFSILNISGAYLVLGELVGFL